MLLELAVENLAVVERLRVRLDSGLTALTGETGSGKSLVVGAMSLLLGGRASAEMIRTGAERAFVSGIFELPSEPAAAAMLAEAGVEAENGELLLAREILAGGKSRAYAGNRPVTAAFLKELAPYLGDIHGQHEQQKLLSTESQRELLDESADAQSALEETAAAFAAWRAAVRELEELDRAEREQARLGEVWSAQRREIEALGLRPGEDAQLENESRVLRNVARLSESATAAHEALSESEHSVDAGLRLALKKLQELARIDESLSAMAATLEPVRISVQEVAHDLRHYLAKLEADPARLEKVETRMAQIEKLKKKYGVTIEEILAFLQGVVKQISTLENAGERRAELREVIQKLSESYRASALRLRALRTKAAKRLEKHVESELAELAMRGTTFRVGLKEAEPSESGLDAVEFLVSANVGEELRPLDKVASGGELSRIALALRTGVTPRGRAGVARTLVFDEVDSGVGGAAAESVGRRLRKIAERNQVVCITHLAQIAGFAHHHFVVSKREVKGRTFAEVLALKQEERAPEIGRMLSGQVLSKEALRHAEKLIEEYQRHV
jgi:DNA repair protein RecN (Recombination protein N)